MNLLSVIVPIYNVEQYLRECLDSLLQINQQDVEVLLINDGSTDSSGAIAKSYANQSPNFFTLIEQENGGLSAARNTGLQHAEGEWIIFLDSDDYICPDAFNKLINELHTSAADVIVYNAQKFYQESGEVENISRKPNPFIGKGIVRSVPYVTGLFNQGVLHFAPAWDKAYKKSVLERLDCKFIQGRLHEDIPFSFSLFLCNINVCYFDEKILFYRIRPGSIATQANSKRYEHIILNIYYLQELFKSSGIKEKALYDYLIMQAKNVIQAQHKMPYSLLFRLLFNNISLKKRAVTLSLILQNLKLSR